MVVAWMVGALATFGVVALSAWRGQLWFHDAPVAEARVCVTELPSSEPPVDAAPAAIKTYLRAHYDEVDYSHGGAFMTGPAYLGEPLVEVRNERLQRFLPGTRFFTTKIENTDIEDKEIETLVSFRHGSDDDDIRTLFSPTYGRPSRKFFGQFLHLPAPTKQDEKEIALGLAELLAAITYEGVARLYPWQAGKIGAELRYAGEHWLDIEITGDRHDRVQKIILKNPRVRSDIDVISDFSVFTDP